MPGSDPRLGAYRPRRLLPTGAVLRTKSTCLPCPRRDSGVEFKPVYLCSRPLQASSFETIALGARLELFYEGGWWPVTVLEKKPADAQLASGPRLHVQAVGYDVKSWAGLSAFRLPSAV